MKEEVILFQGIDVEVRRRAYQKRLGVSVYPNGKVRVSANKTIVKRDILKFLESNMEWIRESIESSHELRKKYPVKQFKDGEIFPYLGEDYQLKFKSGVRTHLVFKDGEIEFTTPHLDEELLPQVRQQYFKSFKKSYREVAEKIMDQRVRFYSQKMKLYPVAVKFRGQKINLGKLLS